MIPIIIMWTVGTACIVYTFVRLLKTTIKGLKTGDNPFYWSNTIEKFLFVCGVFLLKVAILTALLNWCC